MKEHRIIIQGGHHLNGTVFIAGAKNAALPCIAASLLADYPCTLENTPRVEDIHNLLPALERIGAEVSFTGHTFQLQIPAIRSVLIPAEITRATRASILLLGPLLSRGGEANIAFPGGCSIGERKIDFHLDGLRRMGADIQLTDELIIARAKRLAGIEYTFPAKTVTGTENLLMAATLAKGTSILRNCAIEPEIADLASMLLKMGAEIDGIGSSTLTVSGKTSLTGTHHRVIPDRIEAGTYLIAACLADYRISIQGLVPDHLQSLFQILEQMGWILSVDTDQVSIHRGDKAIQPVTVTTEPFPGFPTDLQAQLMTLLTQIDGESRIYESIFNDRFKHVQELNRLGADITIDGHLASIRGATPLRGTAIKTTDLRASAALVLGGLIATGETVIGNAQQLLRGYETMPEKLQNLGAEITIKP